MTKSWKTTLLLSLFHYSSHCLNMSLSHQVTSTVGPCYLNKSFFYLSAWWISCLSWKGGMGFHKNVKIDLYEQLCPPPKECLNFPLLLSSTKQLWGFKVGDSGRVIQRDIKNPQWISTAWQIQFSHWQWWAATSSQTKLTQTQYYPLWNVNTQWWRHLLTYCTEIQF